MIATIDISGWDQERINMTTAMIISLLFKNSISYTKLTKLSNTQFNIETLATDAQVNNVLTKVNIEAEYDAWKVASDAETALATRTYNTRLTEYESNIFVTTSYENIDAYIDGLSTLAELKALLKKMAKALKFRLIK